MTDVNWYDAPDGAMYCTGEGFYKVHDTLDVLMHFNPVGEWVPSVYTFEQLKAQPGYCKRPRAASRMDVIGQNGNTGEHYGVKHDDDKPRYDLLPPIAIDKMAQVLTFGAKKYAPDNWRHVEIERYKAAMLRHSFAILRGETNDPETGLPHAAHVMCCAAFIVEL